MRSRIMIGMVAMVAVAGVTPSAHAADAVVATFARSDIARTKLVVGGAVFQCEQSQCVARAPTYRTLSLEACKLLVKRFGRVETFGDGTKSLPADKLQACQGGTN